MNVFAINLDERVIPFVPIRQFVVSVPIPLRHWMVADHELTLEINRIISGPSGFSFGRRPGEREFMMASRVPSPSSRGLDLRSI